MANAGTLRPPALPSRTAQSSPRAPEPAPSPHRLRSLHQAPRMTSALLTPPADARDVFITVNAPRLITEIGALFSSPSAALAEVVQNAYRAGATRPRFARSHEPRRPRRRERRP